MSDFAADVESAEDAEVNPGELIYGLSVEAFEVATVDAALALTRRPNRQFRYTRAGVLRAAGFPITPTLQSPHFTLGLPQPLTPEAWAVLRETFDGPTINPYHWRRR